MTQFLGGQNDFRSAIEFACTRQREWRGIREDDPCAKSSASRSSAQHSPALLILCSARPHWHGQPVQAQVYPTRPVEIVVPFVAGGTSDIIARMIAQRFTDSWSATVVVKQPARRRQHDRQRCLSPNRRPTAHTLLVTTIAIAINARPAEAHLRSRDRPCAGQRAHLNPLMLVVHPSVPADPISKSWSLSSRPIPANGTMRHRAPAPRPHLATEMFKSVAGIDMVHVPFKGNA